MIDQDLLARYFSACRSAYPEIHTGEAFDASTLSRVRYSAHPFLIPQLSLVFGFPPVEVKDRFRDQIESVHSTDGKEILTLKHAKFTPTEPIPVRITNEDLIKLAVHGNSVDFLQKGGNPPTAEEAVFPVKNAVEIPDDFMPSGLMDLVEGRPITNFDHILEEINPSFTEKLFFPVFRFAGDRPVGLDSLIPLENAFLNSQMLSTGFLIDSVKHSLESFKKSDAFNEFALGRLFRSVRFLVDKKKSRELKPPLFDDQKIALLEANGLIDASGEVPLLRGDLSAQDISEMSTGFEKRNLEIADHWKKTTISLKRVK